MAVFNFPGLAKRSRSFVNDLQDVAAELQLDPNWLLTVMQLESGIDPKAHNPNGDATGLIQFMPATARRLGTTVERLAKMKDTGQLVYVVEFFKPWIGRIHSVGDLYLATFWPSAVGKPSEEVIAAEGERVYDANKSLDVNGDGEITAGDVRSTAERMLARYANTVYKRSSSSSSTAAPEGSSHSAPVKVIAGLVIAGAAFGVIYGVHRLFRGSA
jgi:hypothetical protein